MLEQALTVLAAAGGAAVVHAAGTDTWVGLRQAVARWFARGDARREQAELERLDQTAGELQTADGDVAERTRIRLEAAWQTRIETLLEALDETERTRAADQLRSLLAQPLPGTDVSAGDGGVAVGGNVEIRADHNSAAAWHMGNVNVSVANPPQPGTPQD
ncbi:hypothetical protein [Streptomyces antimycoticus]|uniref:hypothetical protein n=1 Tax=Streptomyces antimycoticus TaxID=68175 RepID=UPI000A38C88D|nr:hypothetical protein [Streptomyces antimycoticus]